MWGSRFRIRTYGDFLKFILIRFPKVGLIFQYASLHKFLHFRNSNSCWGKEINRDFADRNCCSRGLYRDIGIY